jgi:uncharacterized protein (UPF0332 family)
MSDAAAQIVKARESLEFARYALAGEYTEEAGRAAYMAAFHAALAFIAARTGKIPKTHSGTRSEFARLARQEPRISREQIALLGWSYELKNAADYAQEATVPWRKQAARLRRLRVWLRSSRPLPDRIVLHDIERL